MRFLIDSCAGGRLAAWLRERGHDVVEASTFDFDPGDEQLLRRAATEGRVLVTLDKYFSALIFRHQESHSGLILLPDVRSGDRIRLLGLVLDRHARELESGAVITVRGARLRVSRGSNRRE